MSRKPIKAVRFPDGETYLYDGALWRNALEEGRAELLTGTEAAAALETFQRAKLLEFIKPGTRLRAVCTHRSSSGMSARYRVFVAAIDRDGAPYIRELTLQIAAFVGFQVRDQEITMGGCGYSKAFEIGYQLGMRLWPDGTPEPHGTRNGEPDRCGGYALTVD